MEFIAQVENLPLMLGFLLEKAKDVGITGERLARIELAAEEALVNIIHHAYFEANSPNNRVHITYAVSEPAQFTVVIRDSGKAFDPTKEEVSIQSEVPVEERRVGGLGIHMIRQLVDELHYERINNENILSLIFLNKQ